MSLLKSRTNVMLGMIQEAQEKFGIEIYCCPKCYRLIDSFVEYEIGDYIIFMFYFNTPDNSTHTVQKQLKKCERN